MKTHIISGSHRQDSESSKVACYIQKQIIAKGSTAEITELKNEKLPLWDEGMWGEDLGEGHPDWKKLWQPIADQLKAADSFVIIAPEYNGMVAPALKNFFLFLNGDLVGHKPALLVGVSSSTGGAYPIAELRASSYKNNRILYIPDHVIVRDAPKVLTEDPADPKLDARSDTFVKKRLDYSLSILEQYSKALKLVRESGVVNHKDFGNGM
jgi:azobenzene reductase